MQEAYNEHERCAESGRSVFGVVIFTLEWDHLRPHIILI